MSLARAQRCPSDEASGLASLVHLEVEGAFPELIHAFSLYSSWWDEEALNFIRCSEMGLS